MAARRSVVLHFEHYPFLKRKFINKVMIMLDLAGVFADMYEGGENNSGTNSERTTYLLQFFSVREFELPQLYMIADYLGMEIALHNYDNPNSQTIWDAPK